MNLLRTLITSAGLVALVGGCPLPPKSAGDDEPLMNTGPGPADSSTTGPAGGSSASAGYESSVPPSDSASTGIVDPGPGSAGEGGDGCREAVDCAVGECMEAGDVLALTCLLSCQEGLTVDAALAYTMLLECVTLKCERSGGCGASEEPPGTTGGTDGSSSTGGFGSSDGDGSPSQPCLDCVVSNMLDQQIGGDCQPLADACG